MKKFLLLALIFVTTSASAQVGNTIKNIEILNLDNQPTKIPFWGEKNLMIIYMDPDRAGQNDTFLEELSHNKSLKSDNIAGITIMNLKDAPMVPNGLARSIARKRSEKTGAIFLLDDRGTLATKWELGSCDNNTIIMIINPSAEVIFFSKGRITDDSKAEFYEVMNQIK